MTSLQSSHSAPTSHVLNVFSISSKMRGQIVLGEEQGGIGLHLCTLDLLGPNVRGNKNVNKHDLILPEGRNLQQRILLFSGKILKAGSTLKYFMIRPEKNVAMFSYGRDVESCFMNCLQKGKKKPVFQSKAWWRRKVKFTVKGLCLVLQMSTKYYTFTIDVNYDLCLKQMLRNHT